MIFCGDLSFSGSPDEYKKSLDCFLIPALKAAELYQEGTFQEKLIIVPGNHDLDRKLAKKYLPAPLQQTLRNNEQVVEWLYKEEDRNYSLQPFSAYSSLIREFCGIANPEYSHIRSFTIRDTIFQFICLNSSWMCGRNINREGEIEDYGFTIIGEPQIQNISSEINKDSIKIVVLHHPFAWLAPFDKLAVERKLMDLADFILTGHEHLGDAKAIQGTSGNCVIIPSGSSFDRRYILDSNYSNSYNYTIYDIEKKAGIVYFRRWSEKRKAWIADNDTYDSGEFHFSLSKVSTETMELANRTPLEPLDHKKLYEQVASTIRQLIPGMDTIDASATIDKKGIQYHIKATSPDGGLTIPGPTFPTTEAGKLGKEKWEKFINQGLDIDLNEEEANWDLTTLPGISMLPPGTRSNRISIKQNIPKKKVPVFISLSDDENKNICQIDFSYLSLIRFGLLEQEFIIQSGRLGGTFKFILRKDGKSNFTYSFDLSSVSAVDALNTLQFAFAIKKNCLIKIVSIEESKELIILGGIDEIKRPESLMFASNFLKFITLINKRFELNFRYPDGPLDPKDYVNAEILYNAINGISTAITPDIEGPVEISEFKRTLKVWIKNWKVGKPLTLKGRRETPITILGQTIPNLEIDFHVVDATPDPSIAEFEKSIKTLNLNDMYTFRVNYSKVVYEIRFIEIPKDN